ncbi:MAG: hypothetical protein ACE5JR_13045 [Gemmatimonadota bacterium]
MVTIFAVPKPFVDHIAIIQRNAIRSWMRLRPRPEIILCGDEEGMDDVRAEFGLRCIRTIERNEFGTPLLSSVFGEAQRAATHDLMCYVNADIMLMSDFGVAVRRIAEWRREFLIVSGRWDVDLGEVWLFGGEDWEQRLRDYVRRRGKPHSYTGIDLFAFRRGLWSRVPPFALGRTIWDGWLIYQSRASGVPVVDASAVVMAVHQNHEYPSYLGGRKNIIKGVEGQRNLELAGGERYMFNLRDATHVLTAKGVRRALSRHHMRRRLVHALPVLRPALAPVSVIAKFGFVSAEAFTRGLRRVRNALREGGRSWTQSQ